MAKRCPTAKPVGTAMLKGWQLVFRGVATLEEKADAVTPVGVWQLTPRCEATLDIYEGYPRLYRKQDIEVEVNGKMLTAMVYLMNEGLPCLPSKYYYNSIAEGYSDTGLDLVHLSNALEYTKARMAETEGGDDYE